jgi:TonB family protein
MTHVMAYLVLVSAGIGACVVVTELALRTRIAAGRWVWIGALSAVVVATLFVLFGPSPGVRQVGPSGRLVQGADAVTAGMPVATEPATTVVKLADAVLPATWMFASVILLLAMAYGQRRLASERRRSSPVRLNGHEVLLTENLGPAVAGIGDPVVFMPRWVLALDEASQRLLLEHELEHARRRDTTLLLGGAVTAALLPWNPVVWWMVRRLRLAVERDCDARVLAAHPDVRRYADLLLTAASRLGISARLLAAHFGEHHSDLEARIQAMTDRKLKWRPTLAAAMAAAVLIAVSCEAPRPEPLAPGSSGKTSAAAPQVGVEPYFEFQVEKPVTTAAGSVTPRYPQILREAGVEGEVLVSFVVDATGQADGSTFKVIRSTHELFSTAVKQALPAMRFVPAEVGGRKVKQLVQQPFSFALAGAKGSSTTSSSVKGEMVEIPVTGVASGKRLAFTLRRDESAITTPPTIVVYSIDGQELGRGEGLLEKIAPQSIHSVEVFKPGGGCPSNMTCPLIKIRLAKGQTLRR